MQSFGGMLESLGIPLDPARLQKSVKFSAFNQVSAQERLSGFNEKLKGQGAFFRSGKAGQWKTELDPKLVDRIVSDHGDVMERYGYLP